MALLFKNVQVQQHRRSGSIFAHPSPSKPASEPMDSGTATQTRPASTHQQIHQQQPRPPPPPSPSPLRGNQQQGQDDNNDDGDASQGGQPGGSSDPPDGGGGSGGGGDPSSDDDDNDDDDENHPAQQFVAALESFNFILEKLAPGSSSNEKTEVKKPDTFDGTDPRKLCPFLIQLQINLQNHPNAYTTDAAKISFALSYLSGSALEFFEPDILNPNPFNPALWTLDFDIFVKELKDNFGVFDEVGEAEDQLETLHMKDSDKAAKYCGLAPRLKDVLSLTIKEEKLSLLKAQVLHMDSRYWCRQAEKKRENSSGGKGSSEGKGSGGGNSGSGKSSGSSKTKTGALQVNITPTTMTSTSSVSSTSG
ncbi:hypothetical protein D9758_012643 [Tetrapyrgos nigripes]|uniref:DUF4939 domain-containing protein n=1 Tax=Tetrapyrgos nigripes TaxID=182062 RepID=A0A8H5LMZ7_9AGAR|nr:hypothetical protein D9758_012643 [Tetrapyrgos nigripes]